MSEEVRALIAALREQASEHRHLIGTPGTNVHNLVAGGRAFDDVADWIEENYS